MCPIDVIQLIKTEYRELCYQPIVVIVIIEDLA